MTKITDLAALTGVATTDLITAVDVSDTSMAVTGTNKKVLLSELITFLRGNGLVSDAGDTMTGALVLPADPSAALEAATKQYVDAVHGLPAGGATGEILGKTSSANYAVGWNGVAIANVTGLQAALDLKPDSTTVNTIVTLTQAAYDAIGTKDLATLYLITT